MFRRILMIGALAAPILGGSAMTTAQNASAAATVAVPNPLCDTGANSINCWVTSTAPASNYTGPFTWKINTDPGIPGQPPWITISCHRGAYTFSFSFVLNGVTYVSGQYRTPCSSAPWN
jgi:hypothetical protein